MAVDPQIAEAEEQAKKTKTSKGERLFDWLTYGGIAGLGAFALTIPTTYWAKYGGGAKHFARMAKGLEKTGLSKSAAENTVITSALMMGGNIAVIPVKAMEANKAELVEKFNVMLGDKSGDASVDDEPKQTWGSLILSRLAAWTAVFVGFTGVTMLVGKKPITDFEQKFAENIVCKPLGKPTHITGLPKIVENETKLFRHGKIAALDVFATAAAAGLLYAGSRIFAKRNEHWHAHFKSKEAAPDNQPPTDTVEKSLAPPEKLFTNSIQPREPEMAAQAPKASFSETIVAKKSQKPEAALGLSS